jgi:hypothetical protein
MIAHLVGLLLIFMAPEEVYCVLLELIFSSEEKLEADELKNLIRWHLPLNNNDRIRLYQAFGYSYLMTTIRKKRSLADHMSSIGFDILNYSMSSIDSLGSRYIPLCMITDVLLMYLVEGVKMIFRYSYSILKCNKLFIK